MAEAVSVYFLASKFVLVECLQMNLWPTYEYFFECERRYKYNPMTTTGIPSPFFAITIKCANYLLESFAIIARLHGKSIIIAKYCGKFFYC